MENKHEEKLLRMSKEMTDFLLWPKTEIHYRVALWVYSEFKFERSKSPFNTIFYKLWRKRLEIWTSKQINTLVISEKNSTHDTIN